MRLCERPKFHPKYLKLKLFSEAVVHGFSATSFSADSKKGKKNKRIRNKQALFRLSLIVKRCAGGEVRVF